ncbi:MAG TPA: acetamidase/formamidase family protein [Thermomicrobiales bacterium]|nr:acetamidase/formamidase family protein [Thermomicrobiales bacterium]
MPPTVHHLSRDQYHDQWDPELPARLTIASGDTVIFETRDCANGKVRDRIERAALAALPEELRALIDEQATAYQDAPFTAGHPLTGPVAIDGARPGDVLQVDIIEVAPAAWGWTAVTPDFGLLAGEFDVSHVQVWDLRNGRDTALRPGIRVPIEPFCGVIGVAPDVNEPVSTIPPRAGGGNIDIKQLTAGATLYLPVQVPGALVSVGDAHAAQGDGEVCGYGIEMESVSTLRFTLRRDLSLTSPRFETFGPPSGASNDTGSFATTGIGSDLYQATRDAVRDMIVLLTEEVGLERAEAYVLCSVAVDLRISEVVDAPNWLVSAFLPKSLFTG